MNFMRETSEKGRKVKHRLTGQVGLVVGLTHYSKTEREGELKVKWLARNGAIYEQNAHRCEVDFVEEVENQNRTSFLGFLKSVSDWPTPIVWYQHNTGGIGLCWSETPIRAAMVFFGEDLFLRCWVIHSYNSEEHGEGPEIPLEVMSKMEEIALAQHTE